jgi:hypothetical protein
MFASARSGVLRRGMAADFSNVIKPQADLEVDFGQDSART